MILCLDAGNTQIYGGVFDQNGNTVITFRKALSLGSSSDELGLFLKMTLRENGLEPNLIKRIAICSVVPDCNHSLANACRKYFNLEPFFLQAGVKSGLHIKYRNPLEVGADRIANAVAATQTYPDRNIVIVDFGTATTFCAISDKKEYLGGVIMPGLRLSMESLEAKTAKLPKVEIIKPEKVLGRNTTESIQSGLYFGQLAMIEKVTYEIAEESFSSNPIVIGTGGFSSLYLEAEVFDKIIPDLVLKGLYLISKKNR